METRGLVPYFGSSSFTEDSDQSVGYTYAYFLDIEDDSRPCKDKGMWWRVPFP